MKILSLQKGHAVSDVVVLVHLTQARGMEHDEAKALYERDARDLFDLLVETMPGGTFDALQRMLNCWESRGLR